MSLSLIAMSRRVLVLPAAALVISGLVMHRLQREPQSEEAPAAAPAVRHLAPRFELLDQQGQLVKFERYLGRTRLIVVFFDAETGAASDPHLIALRDAIENVERAGVQVVGISTATRYANRQSEEQAGRPFPFPVLTDIDPQQPIPAPVHQLFGLYDVESAQTATGVFLIDRAGMVAWNDGFPVPVADPERLIGSLARGQWPRGVP